jgi:tetratricopeptide (TPR) repeat protein
LSRVVLLLSCLLSVCYLRAQDAIQLDGNSTLFSVMAAVSVAGQEQAGTTDPVRTAIRSHVAAKKPSVLPALRRFVEEHKKADAGANLAQYVSFALTSGEPPEFAPRFIGTEVPPDVAALEGFQPLMIRFYQETEIDALWRTLQPRLEQALGRYQEPVSRAVLEVNGYLRNPTSGYMGRRFMVYLDLVGPANQAHTRSYKDDYYVVVTPSAEIKVEEIRHAYLHYLIDPLATKYAERVNRSRGLGEFAQAAPLLDPMYKSDWLLLATESLIKAVEARLASQESSNLLQQAMEEGYVLAAYFGEALAKYEKQEVAMRLYFPEMLDSINLKKEDKRIENVQFAKSRQTGPEPPSPQPQPQPKADAAGQGIENAEKLYAARELDRAREAYMNILKQTDDRPLHARVYYGLARIAVLEKNLDLAEQLFRKTLELAPDPHTLAWTQVYLGRLYENTPTPENAAEHYRAALAVEGAPAGARQAAQKGLEKFPQTTR